MYKPFNTLAVAVVGSILLLAVPTTAVADSFTVEVDESNGGAAESEDAALISALDEQSFDVASSALPVKTVTSEDIAELGVGSDYLPIRLLPENVFTNALENNTSNQIRSVYINRQDGLAVAASSPKDEPSEILATYFLDNSAQNIADRALEAGAAAINVQPITTIRSADAGKFFMPGQEELSSSDYSTVVGVDGEVVDFQGLSNWFTQSTFIDGVENWILLGFAILIIALVVRLYYIFKGPSKKKRTTDFLFEDAANNVSFDDVAGYNEVKSAMKNIADTTLSADHVAKELGLNIAKNFLLTGPPGTGKTMTAKAFANYTNLPFYQLSGADFIEQFVGVGPKRIRELFTEARRQKNGAIIFIDELDAVGAARTVNQEDAANNSERDSTLNALLVELSKTNETPIFVIGATNRADILDPALVRSGRFDLHIPFELPDMESRIMILKKGMQARNTARDIDWVSLAAETEGLSPADLALITDLAASSAYHRGSSSITLSDLHLAVSSIAAREQDSITATNDSQRFVKAIRYAGQIVGAHYTNAIIAKRYPSLEASDKWQESLASISNTLSTVNSMENNLVALVSGIVAEEKVHGYQTSNSFNTLKLANKLAEEIATLKNAKTHVLMPSTVLAEAYAQAESIVGQRDQEVLGLANLLCEQEYIRVNDVDVILSNPNAITENVR